MGESQDKLSNKVNTARNMVKKRTKQWPNSLKKTIVSDLMTALRADSRLDVQTRILYIKGSYSLSENERPYQAQIESLIQDILKIFSQKQDEPHSA